MSSLKGDTDLKINVNKEEFDRLVHEVIKTVLIIFLWFKLIQQQLTHTLSLHWVNDVICRHGDANYLLNDYLSNHRPQTQIQSVQSRLTANENLLILTSYQTVTSAGVLPRRQPCAIHHILVQYFAMLPPFVYINKEGQNIRNSLRSDNKLQHQEVGHLCK